MLMSNDIIVLIGNGKLKKLCNTNYLKTVKIKKDNGTVSMHIVIKCRYLKPKSG